MDYIFNEICHQCVEESPVVIEFKTEDGLNSCGVCMSCLLGAVELAHDATIAFHKDKYEMFVGAVEELAQKEKG